MAFDDDLVLGMELGASKLFAGLVDAGGRVHGESQLVHPGLSAGTNGAGDDRMFEYLVDAARALVAEAEASGSRVRGVGVGAAGATGPDGIVSAAPLGWRDMPLGLRLSEQLDLPVRVDNDVNLAALGELHFGAGRGARNLVCISIGEGLGGALIIDGKLHRGHHGAAGSLGAFLPGPPFLGWNDPAVGALESMVSASGIAARARALAESAGLPLPPDGLRAEDVFSAAADGAGWASSVLEETVDYLAAALVAVQALVDPERIVIGIGVAGGVDHLIAALDERLAGALPRAPILVRSELGHLAAVMGAGVAVRATLGTHFKPL
jgi:glucokinase